MDNVLKSSEKAVERYKLSYRFSSRMAAVTVDVCSCAHGELMIM